MSSAPAWSGTASRASYRLWEALFALLVLGTTLPLWVASYLPIEDLPQHLAAIRVLHSYGDPQFGFSQFFELGLFRTQYLAYYLAAHWLSFVLPLPFANLLLIAACVTSTPYALRALLRALGRDERFALFALPLTYNAHFILGFFNFLLAIPLAFFGLALVAQQRRQPSRTRPWGTALVALVCFYAHVVPFMFLALGSLLLSLERSPKAMLRSLAPLAPALVAGALWAALSPAGRATVTAARGAHAGPVPYFQPFAAARADLPNWLTDVLQGDDDARLLHAYLALIALTLAVGVVRSRSVVPAPPASDELSRTLALRLWLLPLLAAALYFVAPTSYDWIWPIAQRFPLLALLFLIPVLPRPPRYVGTILIALLICVHVLQMRLVNEAFRNFSSQEVGDFDHALALIPARQRVAGLIFWRGSQFVKFSPFIHYVAYYQARKGGAVMFSFADFPQSPFRFREDNRPPRVPPRWEWLPERVRPTPELAWYDYVLTRGGPGVIQQDPQHFVAIYRGSPWSVWKKLRSAPGTDTLAQ